MAAGSGYFCVNAGTYLFYVEHVSGGLCNVDLVEFVNIDNPVETTSWGAIKALYRR